MPQKISEPEVRFKNRLIYVETGTTKSTKAQIEHIKKTPEPKEKSTKKKRNLRCTTQIVFLSKAFNSQRISI